MTRFYIVALLFFATSVASAETITYSVDVAEDTVAIGGTVNWQVFVTVSDSDAGNFGIAAAAFSLQESHAETLSPATIGAPFGDYTLPNTGTSSGNQLLDVGAALLAQNSSVEGENSSLGPHLLASGSYTVNSSGTHTLSAANLAGTSTSRFFTAAGQINGAGTEDFATVDFGSDTFTVSAVPEPGTLSLVVFGTIVFGVAARRRRKTKSYCTSGLDRTTVGNQK